MKQILRPSNHSSSPCVLCGTGCRESHLEGLFTGVEMLYSFSAHAHHCSPPFLSVPFTCRPKLSSSDRDLGIPHPLQSFLGRLHPAVALWFPCFVSLLTSKTVLPPQLWQYKLWMLTLLPGLGFFHSHGSHLSAFRPSPLLMLWFLASSFPLIIHTIAISHNLCFLPSSILASVACGINKIKLYALFQIYV